jgi:probable rRNA maturation factor
MASPLAVGFAPATHPDLDLAFEAAADLPAALLERAGGLADPWAGAERWHRLFSLWLAELAGELPGRLAAGGYCLGLGLVNDATIAELNRAWRHRDGATDVLAFAAQDGDSDGLIPPLPARFDDGSEPEDDSGSDDGEDDDRDSDDEDGAVDRDSGGDGEVTGLELGDIVISLETAARQAGDQGHDLAEELLVLASHGLLHLLGWDHPDEARLAAMLARQDRLIEAARAAGLA